MDIEQGWTVDQRVTRVEVQLANNTAEVTAMRGAIDRLGSQVNGRPSWAVLTILSLSTMANGALLTALVAALHTGH